MPALSRRAVLEALAGDLGYGDAGLTGCPGMRFAHACAHGPVCNPTPAALLTGQYQPRLGHPSDKKTAGNQQVSRTRAVYRTVVEALHAGIGRILERLKKRRLGESAAVLVFSDSDGLPATRRLPPAPSTASGSRR